MSCRSLHSSSIVRELKISAEKTGACTGFLIRAPGRAHLLGDAPARAGKIFTHPRGGSVSRTARVPAVRQDLKEAVPPKAGTKRNRIRGGCMG